MSRSFARESEHTVDSLMVLAIACTHSKSPLELAAKPASITFTRRRSSWRAIRSFSSRVMLAPGDCSPSRKVVSKMMSLSVMELSRKTMGQQPAGKNVQQRKRPAAGANGPLQEKVARATVPARSALPVVEPAACS